MDVRKTSVGVSKCIDRGSRVPKYFAFLTIQTCGNPFSSEFVLSTINLIMTVSQTVKISKPERNGLEVPSVMSQYIVLLL